MKNKHDGLSHSASYLYRDPLDSENKKESPILLVRCAFHASQSPFCRLPRFVVLCRSNAEHFQSQLMENQQLH